MGQGVTTCEETRGRFKIEYSSSSRSNVHQTSALRGTATRRASGWNPTRELAWCHATQHASPRRSVRRNRTASAHCVRGGAARLPRFRGASKTLFDVAKRISRRAGIARVPSGCSCLNVERADMFVVDKRGVGEQPRRVVRARTMRKATTPNGEIYSLFRVVQ